MTNEEAILRLARTENDVVALMAVVLNSSGAMKAAVERYFVVRERRKREVLTLLLYISWHAKEFVPGHDASQWIEGFAETWCRRTANEAKIPHRAQNPFPSWTWEASPKYE